MLGGVNGKWHKCLPYVFMLVAALSRWPKLFPPNFSAFYGLAFCAGAFFPRHVFGMFHQRPAHTLPPPGFFDKQFRQFRMGCSVEHAGNHADSAESDNTAVDLRQDRRLNPSWIFKPVSKRLWWIKHAVEKAFKVKVVRVNTLRVRGKARRQRTAQAGVSPAWKKAVVTLKAGDKIELS